MSDQIQPILQWPTPCDFGPFLGGGFCGKVVSIDFKQATSEISIADLTMELFETATANIILSDLVTTKMPIDWTKTTFVINPAVGIKTFNESTKTLTYKPDETLSVDRTINISYTVTDEMGVSATGKIIINVVDKTPVLTINNVTLSGTESQTFTIDPSTITTATNTTVNYTQTGSVVISVAPLEGTAVVTDGKVIYTPNQTPSTTRTITFKFKVTCLAGISAESTVSITISDITPAITTSNVTKSVTDNTTLSASILSNITIKNDTFKTLAFGNPSEGSITVNGSNYVFTPGTTIKSNRTINVPYTITTTSGLTSSSVLTINITYYNLFANTFWYGNFANDAIVESNLTPTPVLTAKTATGYAGTYPLTGGSGVYKYFVYPKSWGITPTIVDATTLFEIATDDYKYITIDGIELIVIRTYYQVNGAINVKFS